MDDGLRPREIQARIRAGQSSTQIADASGMPLEKVARFEAPVLAERAHVADRARATEARRYDGATFGSLVEEALKGRGVDLRAVTWDSWRRDDGLWTVSVAYDLEDSQSEALFTYDMVARAVVAQDHEARELLDPGSSAAAADDRPHLVSVPSVSANEVYDLDRDLASSEQTVVVPLATVDDNVLELIHEPVEQFEEPTTAPTAPTARPVKPAKGKRASVPSWDEILFGGTEDSV